MPLNYVKCRQCRKGKQKCLPLGRVWPDRCNRCLQLGYLCSVGREKSEETLPEYPESGPTDYTVREVPTVELMDSWACLTRLLGGLEIVLRSCPQEGSLQYSLVPAPVAERLRMVQTIRHQLIATVLSKLSICLQRAAEVRRQGRIWEGLSILDALSTRASTLGRNAIWAPEYQSVIDNRISQLRKDLIAAHNDVGTWHLFQDTWSSPLHLDVLEGLTEAQSQSSASEERYLRESGIDDATGSILWPAFHRSWIPEIFVATTDLNDSLNKSSEELQRLYQTNSLDVLGRTPLHYEFKLSEQGYCCPGTDLQCHHYHRGMIDIEDDFGFTASQYASLRGDGLRYHWLLRHGAEPVAQSLGSTNCSSIPGTLWDINNRSFLATTATANSYALQDSGVLSREICDPNVSVPSPADFINSHSIPSQTGVRDLEYLYGETGQVWSRLDESFSVKPYVLDDAPSDPPNESYAVEIDFQPAAVQFNVDIDHRGMGCFPPSWSHSPNAVSFLYRDHLESEPQDSFIPMPINRRAPTEEGVRYGLVDSVTPSTVSSTSSAPGIACFNMKFCPTTLMPVDKISSVQDGMMEVPGFRASSGATIDTGSSIEDGMRGNDSLHTLTSTSNDMLFSGLQNYAPESSLRPTFPFLDPMEPSAQGAKLSQHFQCPEYGCGKSFISLPNLSRHIKSTHRRKIACRHCKKLVSQRLDYTRKHLNQCKGR